MRVAWVVAVALFASGCPFGFGNVNQINRIPQSEPLDEPVLFNRPGVLVHDPTGFAFPERYDDFQRVTAYRYDSEGLNVGIGYNDRSASCLIVATFYLYPGPRMSFIGTPPNVVASIQEGWLRDEYGRAAAGIDAANPGIQEGTARAPEGVLGERLISGPVVSFPIADQLSELQIQLYDRQWFIKYRYSYARACEEHSRARITALERQLPWAESSSEGSNSRE